MDLEYVKQCLQESGWKNVRAGLYAGNSFDLIGARRYFLDQWLILVKVIPALDMKMVQEVEEIYNFVAIKSFNQLWSKKFLLFLVTPQTAPQALHRLKLELRSRMTIKGHQFGVGLIYAVDEKDRQVLGPFPPFHEVDRRIPQNAQETFANAFTPGSLAFEAVSIPAKAAQLNDDLRPTSVLKLLEGNPQPELEIFRIDALRELGRYKEACERLEKVIPQLQADDLARAMRMKARYLMGEGDVDGGILLLEEARLKTQNNELRAAIIAAIANGYGAKHCWELAKKSIQKALQISPDDPRALMSQAGLHLQMDQRLEARAIYDRMAGSKTAWVKSYADFERGHVAFLLGEFDEASELAQSALQYSDEIINPLMGLIAIALAKNDLDEMENMVWLMEERSPKADVLEGVNSELSRLKQRLSGEAKAPQKRLVSFPTLVQRRDHCGPCVIELVLGYWKGGLDLTNDQIAEKVKLPQGGTPIYRMTEFFHLVGFDTIHCFAPVEQLKRLIDAGYPAIIEQEFSGNYHVSVVIGYDDAAGTIELQDPGTHIVLPVPLKELERVRQTNFNSAILAFPAGKGHDTILARMGIFNDETLSLIDRAHVASDAGRQADPEIYSAAIQKQPLNGLAWILWLNARLSLWQAAKNSPQVQPGELALKLNQKPPEDPQVLREQFYAELARAKQALPKAEFIYHFEGQAALAERDVPRALAAFEQAKEINDKDPHVFAALAECHFALRDVEKALQAAGQALKIDPASPAANVWMARCLAYLEKDHSDHYARAGLELAPAWWMAHLAAGESFLQQRKYPDAWRENETALSQFPNHPEARILRGRLLASRGDEILGVGEFEAVLKENGQLNPITCYKAHRAVCSTFFNGRVFDAAIAQATQLLSIFPDDPWALQFLAAANFEKMIQDDRAGHKPEIAEITRLQSMYETAIEANKGTPWIVKDYLNCLCRVGCLKEAVEIAVHLPEKYPQQGHLAYIKGDLLWRSEQLKAAAEAMLGALTLPDGFAEEWQLCEAVRCIIHGMGLEEGEKCILNAPLPAGGYPMSKRLRALGLIFALYPKERAARAREILQPIVEDNPEDEVAFLRLGKVAERDADREEYYRKALFLTPAWSYGRSNLAEYLNDKGRYKETLEFTAGHENDSLEILAAHAWALNGVGRYEESMEAIERVFQNIEKPEPYLCYRKWLAEYNGGQYEKSLATADRACQLFSDAPVWYFYVVTSQCILERFEEAVRTVEIGKSKGLAGNDLLRAEYEIAEDRQDYAQALTIVDQLIVPPKPGQANAGFGWWKKKKLRALVELGRLNEARAFVREACQDAQSWAEAASALLETRADKLILDFASRALERDAQNFTGLYAYAVAAQKLDQKDARQAFMKLWDAHPLRHNAYEYLARYDALEGKLEDASSMAELAVSLGAFCHGAWAARGYVNFLQGRRTEALRDLQAAWNRADPDNRRTNNASWWLYYALQGNAELSQARKKMAVEQASSSFDRQILAQIDGLLAQ